MRVGTISFNTNAPDFNYGAILHSWAFQKVLDSFDFVQSSEIIDYTMPSLEGQNLKYPMLDIVRGRLSKRSLRGLVKYPEYLDRYRKFQRFIKENMRISNQKYIQESLNIAVLPYDTVICESDVIWSPGFCGGHMDKSFFLALDSMRNMKRIAYAPSMGDGNLSNEQGEELKHLLNYLDEISCRESYEKNLIQQYTRKEVTQVLDPVMLLDSCQYDPIISAPLTEKKYILLYLPVDDNPYLRKNAQEYAKKYGFQTVEISTKLKTEGTYRTLLSAGPEEFLSGVKYAEAVFTNSFHAICFSLIFNKQFYAFSRRYSGKIRDICEGFSMRDRYYENDFFQEQPDIDYQGVNQVLIEKRDESRKWLEKALLGGG